RLASSAGCRGAVCSSREVAALRRDLGKEFVLVTPGIRPPGYHEDDQRRTASPAEALAAGSNLLVIGRPLTRAADPDRALDALESAITLGPNA
ncbi:MAG: orotidine 5'-phosphate decarboxylase, partial [Acidobacteriota bacterium]|nr:orotidine 5'-phosphate decarboxylase [Acidobacteriota bacterium]